MPHFAHQLAIDRPEEIALRDPQRAMRWIEVDDVLNRVANGLRAYDLGPKKRIAVFAENAGETALAHLGGLLGGASTVPVNFHLTADETAYILQDSQTAVLFVGPETIERGVAAAAVAGVKTIIAWRCEAVHGVVCPAAGHQTATESAVHVRHHGHSQRNRSAAHDVRRR